MDLFTIRSKKKDIPPNRLFESIPTLEDSSPKQLRKAQSSVKIRLNPPQPVHNHEPILIK